MLVKARDEKKGVSDLGRMLHVMVRSQMVSSNSQNQVVC